MKNDATSYFVGTEAAQNRPTMHLAGDRNVLGLAGQNCQPAAMPVGSITQLNPTKDNPRWDNTIHNRAGNMAMTDGSAQQLSKSALLQHLSQTGDPNLSNCVLKP